MYRFIIALFTYFLLLKSVSDAYEILAIFPTPSYSHQIVFEPVVQELVKRGHRVKVLSPYPHLFDQKNVTRIDLSDLRQIWDRMDFVEAANMAPQDFITTFIKLMEDMLVAILNHHEVKTLLSRERHFDGVICEMLGYTPMYAFATHFNTPLIGISSMDLLLGHHRDFGNVQHPVLHPHFSLPFFGEMNFLERCQAVYADWLLQLVEWHYARRFDKIILKYFGRTVGDSYAVAKRMSVAIVNAHPVLKNVRPIVPTTVQVGFMHIKSVKPLPVDLNTFLNSSSTGTIYVSFGSNVKSSNLAQDKVEVLLQTFSELCNYKIIWKWEQPNLKNCPSNVFISPWLPQTDILGSGKVDLFITQGGQQSLEEAVYFGVPLLAIPFFGDQEMNARRIETLKIGRRLSLKTLSTSHLVSTVQEVLNDSLYKNHVGRLSVIVKDTPMTAATIAAWWIEYTIRHNGTHHLRYPAVDMPAWKYHLLDVYLFTALVIGLLFSLIRLTFGWLYKRCQRHYQHQQYEKEQKHQRGLQRHQHDDDGVDDDDDAANENKNKKLKAL